MDIVFVLGLPRSGTSLVHNILAKETNRLAVTYKDLNLDIPPHLRDYHRANELAEIHDLDMDLPHAREWLERRGDRWVVKSVELDKLPLYLETFPEARFLVTVRTAGSVMASVMDYFQATGLRWPYSPTQGLNTVLKLGKVFPEKFSWVDVESLPHWSSTPREPSRTLTVLELKTTYEKIKGNINRVDYERIKTDY
jgi:hypothetical protein